MWRRVLFLWCHPPMIRKGVAIRSMGSGRLFSDRFLGLDDFVKERNRLNQIFLGPSTLLSDPKIRSSIKKFDAASCDSEGAFWYLSNLKTENELRSGLRFLLSILETGKDLEILASYSKLMRNYLFSALISEDPSQEIVSSFWNHPALYSSGIRDADLRNIFLYSEVLLKSHNHYGDLLKYHSSFSPKSLHFANITYYMAALLKLGPEVPFTFADDIYRLHCRRSLEDSYTWRPLYALSSLERGLYSRARNAVLGMGDDGSLNVLLKLLCTGGRFDEGSILIRSYPESTLSLDVFRCWRSGMLEGDSSSLKELHDIETSITRRVKDISISDLIFAQILAFDARSLRAKYIKR